MEDESTICKVCGGNHIDGACVEALREFDDQLKSVPEARLGTSKSIAKMVDFSKLFLDEADAELIRDKYFRDVDESEGVSIELWNTEAARKEIIGAIKKNPDGLNKLVDFLQQNGQRTK